jgi:hypothetical protein
VDNFAFQKLAELFYGKNRLMQIGQKVRHQHMSKHALLTLISTLTTWGGVKTERVFPGLSVLRKNKKMKYCTRKIKKGEIGPA